MPTLRLGETASLWSASAVADLSAGDYSAVAEFLPGKARGFAEFVLSFSSAPTAFDIDIEFSEAGTIYRRLVNFTNVGGERASFASTPGFYRAKVNSLTAAGAETVTLTVAASVDAPTALNTLQIDEVHPSITKGACIQLGLDAAPITDDTADVEFVSMHFDSGGTGSQYGMRLKFDATADLQLYSKGLRVDMTTTIRVRNPCAIQASLTLSHAVVGTAAALQTEVSTPNLQTLTGTHTAFNVAVYAGGSASDHHPNSSWSMIRFQVGGDATGCLNFQQFGYALLFQGFTAAAVGAQFNTPIITNTKLAELPAGNLGIKVGVGAVGAGAADYYIPLVPVGEWN